MVLERTRMYGEKLDWINRVNLPSHRNRMNSTFDDLEKKPGTCTQYATHSSLSTYSVNDNSNHHPNSIT